MSQPKLLVRRVGPIEVPLPAYQTAGSAGLDLAAAVAEPVTLVPGERKLIKTGLSIAIPMGYEAQVRPRSGLALRHGIGMVNTPGTIDADYRGEVGVLLINLGQEPFTVEPLARIGQLVITPVAHVDVVAVETLDETARGAGGYGSTGV